MKGKEVIIIENINKEEDGEYEENENEKSEEKDGKYEKDENEKGENNLDGSLKEFLITDAAMA
jgi:hypothetical protein